MSEHEHEEGGSERWLVSYADFITLLFAFFAVLYATSQKDVEKSKEFQESIRKFLMKTGGVPGTGATAQIPSESRAESAIESPIETFKRDKAETSKDLDKAATFLEAKFTPAERAKYIQDLSNDDWGVRLILPASALFTANSERFREDALPFLMKLSDLLADSERKILIEGHVATGENGSFRSPWDFASARAINLLRFIQKKKNLEAARLASASLGDTRPLTSKPSARDARVEVVLLNSDLEL